MVTVRYIVLDVDSALTFYCERLGFREVMHPAPTFAMLRRDDLRLVLSAPGGGPGGGAAMPDGTLPAPGGWNRFSLEVDDLAATVAELESAGARFRGGVVEGVGGRQILVEDPSGNAVELFEPTIAEARATVPEQLRLQPVGVVRSSISDPVQAPRQGDEGAPDADLLIDAAVLDALRGLEIGDEVVVLTWLHLAERNVLTVHPRGDATRAEAGVFATRAPVRPNPIGLHRVRILDIDEGRVRVAGLEAVDGTPILDIKPVLHGVEER